MNPTTPSPQPFRTPPASLRHQKRSEFGLVFTKSLHEACFIGTVTGQRGECQDTGTSTAGGAPQKRWVFKSTPEVDEAKALWGSLGLPAFGTPKDWPAMNLDEKKAIVNVVTAFAANLRVYLKDVH